MGVGQPRPVRRCLNIRKAARTKPSLNLIIHWLADYGRQAQSPGSRKLPKRYDLVPPVIAQIPNIFLLSSEEKK